MSAVRPASKRRFSLSDVLVLIAAIAIGLAALRTYVIVVRGHSHQPPRHLYEILAAVGFLLQPLAVALVILGLRRHGWRRSITFRRPGMAACLATCLMIFFVWFESIPGLIHSLRRISIGPRSAQNYSQNYYWIWLTHLRYGGAPDAFCPAVLAAWGTLALTGRWRIRRDWMDIMGVVIGLWWVVAYLGWAAYRYTW